MKDVVKGILSFAGSACVSSMVGLFIKQNIAPEKKLDKISCAVGSFVLSSMISDQADKYLDAQIDQVYDIARSIKHSQVLKKLKAEAKTNHILVSEVPAKSDEPEKDDEE